LNSEKHFNSKIKIIKILSIVINLFLKKKKQCVLYGLAEAKRLAYTEQFLILYYKAKMDSVQFMSAHYMSLGLIKRASAEHDYALSVGRRVGQGSPLIQMNPEEARVLTLRPRCFYLNLVALWLETPIFFLPK